jgi:small subunit ribosomal protein S14
MALQPCVAAIDSRIPAIGAGALPLAKLSQELRDEKRKKLIAKYAEKRAELRKRLNDANLSVEEKFQIQEQFAKLPRNSCPTRLNRRCKISGRSRGYYRKFGISRIAFRELALKGQLPGVRKSSW